MSLPSCFFLDTSILAGQKYNFSSAALTSFAPVASGAGLTLLLPDPTEMEIRRQIQEKSKEALEALEKARREAPFLSKWEHFPKKVANKTSENWRIQQVALAELEAFFAQFKNERLDYSGINIKQVMNWYQHQEAPFQSGKKRKEFPDAFAVAILVAYAKKTGKTIAVVSEDADFKEACLRFPQLLYFKSLPLFTELLVAKPDELEKYKASILGDTEKLESHIAEAVSRVDVIHNDPEYEIEDSSVASVSVTDARVVSLGSNECTLAFEAEVELEVRLAWQEWDDEPQEFVWEKSWLIQTVFVTGSAKVSISEGEKHQIAEVSLVILDQYYLEIDENPHVRW